FHGPVPVRLQYRRPEMLALSEIAEVGTIAPHQKFAVLVREAHIVELAAPDLRPEMAGVVIRDARRPALEETHSLHLNAFIELECESGGQRHQRGNYYCSRSRTPVREDSLI